MRKALKDGGKITITIENNRLTGIRYCVQEDAFRLTGIERGEIAKEALEAAEDPDAIIQQEISAAVRKNHISWGARQE
jgi:hypothetical protein